MAASTHNRFPTWIVVVSILILAVPVIWGLSTFMHIIAAMSLGRVLVAAALVTFSIWLKNRVDD